MDEESKWPYAFYPSDSRGERIRKLEALLAHKAANGEPITDTIEALQVLREHQQSVLTKVFMQWVKRPRIRFYPKQETTLPQNDQGFIGNILVSVITSLIVLTIFFGGYEAGGGKAYRGTHSVQGNLLKK